MHYPADSQRIEELLDRSDRILVVSHANPDADSIASLLAFRLAFSRTEREMTLAIGPGTVPDTLAFLPGLEELVPIENVNLDQFDLMVFLDCADERRVVPGEPGFLQSGLESRPVINIDHHISNSRFGSVNLVDPEGAATCEVLALLFQDLEIPLNQDLATILLTGIQGDTLGLRTPSTTGRTLSVSASLLDAGANLDLIVDYLFRLRPYSTLKLWAQALAAVRFTGKLIWTELTPEMFEQAAADESEAEGIVNFLAGTIGARAAALLYKKPDGWRISMRSLGEDVDVAELAGLFGGGGHSRAAGCSLTGDLSVRDNFLNTIADRIERRPAAAHSDV